MALSLGRITGTFDLEDNFTKTLESNVKDSLATMGNLGSAITGIAAGFVIAEKVIGAFINALSGAAKEMAALAARAEHLQNKSLSTGLSTGAIQSLERLSQNAGLSADAVTFAVGRMQRSLAGGGEAFRKIGLDAQALLGTSTQEQLKTVAERIISIENPAERVSAAMTVFGRSGRDLIPVLKELAEGNEALKTSMSDEQIANLAELDDAIDDMEGAWSDLKEQFFATIAASPGFVAALKEITNLIVAAIEPVGILASGIGMLADHFYEVAKSPLELARVLGLANVEMLELSKTTQATIKQFGQGGNLDLGIPSAEEALKMMNLDDLKKGYGSIEEQQRKINDEIKKSEDHQKELNRATDEMNKSLAETHLERQKLLRIIEEEANKTGFVIPDLPELGKITPGILAPVTEGLPNAMEQASKLLAEGFSSETIKKRLMGGLRLSASDAESVLAALGKKLGDKSLGQALGDSLKSGLAKLPDVILGAIQGGGNVGEAIGASLGADIGKTLGDQLSKAIGGKLGESLGGLLGPLGSIAGSFLGKGIDKLAGALGIGGNKVIMQVNDMRDAFFQAQGGFVELQKKLQGLTDQDLVKKIFDAKTVDQFNAAVSEVMGLLDTQAMAQENLNAAIERYGFTLEELPAKMRQDELDAGFGQLLQDYELLTAAGFETNTILERMGPSINDMVNQAISAGGTIPEAFRPIIEQMIAQGQLLDENGNAYESVEDAGITFAQTMTEQFQTLIEKIDQMVSALLGIPSEVNTNVNVNTNYTSTGSGAGGQANQDNPRGPWDAEFQHGGVVTEPTVGLIGEAGPEAIIPLAELPGMMGTSGPSSAEISPQSLRGLARAIRDAMIQAS